MFQKFFGKMVKIKEMSLLSTRGMGLMFGNCIVTTSMVLYKDLQKYIVLLTYFISLKWKYLKMKLIYIGSDKKKTATG